MRSRYIFLKSGAVYFVTFSIQHKIPIFTNKSYFDLIISNFEFCRSNNNLRVFYYVIMDNHIHLICHSEKDLSELIRCMKSYMAKEIIKLLKVDSRTWILDLLKLYKKDYKFESEYQMWEEGSHPEQILSYEMLNQKAEYIHYNPVKRGIVYQPEDWYYSSSRNIHNLSNPFRIDELDE